MSFQSRHEGLISPEVLTIETQTMPKKRRIPTISEGMKKIFNYIVTFSTKRHSRHVPPKMKRVSGQRIMNREPKKKLNLFSDRDSPQPTHNGRMGRDVNFIALEPAIT
ncbi:hypothetical protein Lal_00043275 [Lupinus albus]|nr:hypothetical protein Lal_00043275 [Lupinus albus]